MPVINVNFGKNEPADDNVIERLIKVSSGYDSFAYFDHSDRTPEPTISQKREKAWGDVPKDTFLWGAKDNILSERSLDRKSWENIVNHHKSTSKALTAASGASVFVPTMVASSVIDVIAKKTPFYAMAPKRAATSSSMTLPKRSTDQIDSIDFSAENANELTAIDQSYGSISVSIKLLFVAGVITHFAQAATQTVLDLYSQEVNDHFIDLIGFKEKVAFKGETTADGTWAAHFTVSNGYDGIAKSIESNAPAANFTALSGTAISLSHIDSLFKEIHDNNGTPTAIFCDTSTFFRLKGFARDFKRLGANDTQFGFPQFSMSIDGVPVFASRFMSSAANEKAAVCIDLNAIEYRVLVPDTFYEVAQNRKPVREFFFETFEALVIKAAEQCAAVVNGL